VVACFFYVEFLLNLMSFKKFHPENLEKAKFKAYAKTQNDIRDYLIHREIPEEEREIFVRLLFDNITELPEDEIFSSGYVVHTLEASVWAFLTTNSYKEAVCKAVNLGDDTDTSGSVTGGMAGLFYGSEAIPQLWIESIARKEDILDLVNRMNTILDS
jgi:ADP-ribosylglycohydrolase